MINQQIITEYVGKSQLTLTVVGLGYLVSPGFAVASYHSSQFAIESDLMKQLGVATEDSLRATATYRISQIEAALPDSKDTEIRERLVDAVRKSLHAYVTGDYSEIQSDIDRMTSNRDARPDFGSLQREEPIDDEDAPDNDADFWRGLLGR